MNDKETKDESTPALRSFQHLSLLSAIYHSISSDLTNVDIVCRDARALLDRHGQTPKAFAVELLLREFINNAIIHGNCSDISKRVKILVRISRKRIIMWIADEGQGFNWRSLRRVAPAEDATSGRGMAIGATYSQRIHFNRTGNQVTLWINKSE